MKKNKNTQLILIALVLVIWAGVAWQIFAIKKEVTPSDVKEIKSQESIKITAQANPFPSTLKVNYPDPFLSSLEVNNEKAKPVKRSGKQIPAKQQAEIPGIRYLGYLFSENQKQVILEINKVVQSYPVNKKKGSVKVSFVSKDSVLVRWNNQSKIVYRSY